MFFVGVNGCKGGWLGVALADDGHASHQVASDFADLAKSYQRALILVDIPIGLRDTGTAERLCDTAARSVLGPRASSVFPAPCRTAIEKASYAAASADNEAKTGRRLSKQSWAITAKIRQLDEYLRSHSGTGAVVREVHPEVCFWGLAGRPMRHSKHAPEGRVERLGVLERVFPRAEEVVGEITRAHLRSVLREDDVLDALVAAVTGLVGAEKLKTLPEAPERDRHGLRMEMVYASG